MGLIFRNDDVSFNTNISELFEMYGLIKKLFPTAEIWSGVTLFAEANDIGAIYSEVPFKHQEKDWFYKANKIVGNLDRLPLSKICSHGLYHVDHSALTYDAQQMSILGSCKFLKTKVFIPPFNRYNEHTQYVCEDYGVELVKRDGWKSLEFEPFNPDHEKWYFHSWRYTVESLKKALNENCKNVG